MREDDVAPGDGRGADAADRGDEARVGDGLDPGRVGARQERHRAMDTMYRFMALFTIVGKTVRILSGRSRGNGGFHPLLK
jgi:hypothetical protein